MPNMRKNMYNETISKQTSRQKRHIRNRQENGKLKQLDCTTHNIRENSKQRNNYKNIEDNADMK